MKFKDGSKQQIGKFYTRRSPNTVEQWAQRFLENNPYYIAYLYDIRSKDRPCICVYHPEHGRMTEERWEDIKKGKVKVDLEVKLMMLLSGNRGVVRRVTKLPYPIYLKSKNPDDVYKGLEAIAKQVRNHDEFQYFNGGTIYVNGNEVGKMDSKLSFISLDKMVLAEF